MDDSKFITHHDPALTGQMFLGFALGMVPGGGGSRLVGAGIRTAEEAAAAEGAAAAEEPASEVWKQGWAKRGQNIEDALTSKMQGARTGPNYPVIDFMEEDGTVTSIKSIDLNDATYQDPGRLTYRINDYVRKLADFNGATYGKTEITEENITGKVLNIAIPKGSMTALQKGAIDSASSHAKAIGITLKITPF